MTTRQRRSLASAVSSLVVAVLCALLAVNVEGGRRATLVVLTFAWLVVAAACLASALRPVPALPAAETVDEKAGASDDPS